MWGRASAINVVSNFMMWGEGVCYQRRFKLHDVGEDVCYQRRFELHDVGGGSVLSTSFQTSLCVGGGGRVLSTSFQTS